MSLDTSVRAHSRIVTDIAWHTFDRNILTSSAADTFIYLWDLRDLRRPKQSLQSVAGAAKIQWNKVSGKYLASAHEGEVKIWDTRNPSGPVQFINAHLSRIYDIDWSYEQEDSLATSSQDSTVQFWNLASPQKSENMIRVPGTPVWKLQHTPVGSGLLTLVMQSVFRGQNNLMLWNTEDRQPVHTFYGHDMVLDFAWFNPPQNQSRANLVTWSRDSSLRIWELDSDLQKKILLDTEEDVDIIKDEAEESNSDQEGFFKLDKDDVGGQAGIGEVVEEEGAVIINSPTSLQNKRDMMDELQMSDSYIPELSMSSSVQTGKSMNLNYEFSLINVSDKLSVIAQDPLERLFTVSAETDKNALILHVKFPPNYPNQKAPIFSFLQGTTVDHTTRNVILGKLRNVAKQQISKNRRCLESCLRQFESCLTQLSETEEEQIKLNNPGQVFPKQEITLENREDEKIPYPRSSGARFCGDGNLVCFGCSRSYSIPVAAINNETQKVNVEVARTPRALSSMTSGTVSLIASGAASPKYSMVGLSLCTSPSQENGYLSLSRVPRVRFANNKSRFSVTSVPVEDGLTGERKISSKSARPVVIGTVTVYSCTGILPYSKELAPLYKVPSLAYNNLEEICNYNSRMCARVDRPDLAHIWTLLGLSVTGCNLAHGPFNAPWAMNPFGRFMVEDMIQHFIENRDVQTAASIIAVFGNKCQADIARITTRKKNSKSESLKTEKDVVTVHSLKKFSRTQSEIGEERKVSMFSELAEKQVKMIPSSKNKLYDSYILDYAELLYRWKMLKERTELLKCMSSNAHSQLFAAKITSSCDSCGQAVSGARCVYCHSTGIQCSICRLSCPGMTVVCPRCSHGGHPRHLQSWFASHQQCPTGCGCQCLQYQM